MSKKNRSSERFSSAKNEQTPQKLRPHNTVGNKAKEQKALILIQKGRRNEAELIFKELVAAGSQSHITPGTLGALLQMKGDLQNAILYFNSALQLKPNYPQAHFNLGIALHEQGDLIAAIASYNSALQLKPNYPEAHNNLGNAHKKLSDLTAAIASYNSALQLKPNYQTLFTTWALRSKSRATKRSNHLIQLRSSAQTQLPRRSLQPGHCTPETGRPNCCNCLIQLRSSTQTQCRCAKQPGQYP